jgi:hypothetical protein
MDRKQNTWVTCILLMSSMFSATVIFWLAEIHIDTFLTCVIYGTSVGGFFYLYLSAATFVLKNPKSKSSSGQSLN